MQTCDLKDASPYKRAIHLNVHKNFSLGPTESTEGNRGVIGSGRPRFLRENSWKRAKTHTKPGRKNVTERERRWRREVVSTAISSVEQVIESHGDGALCLADFNTHTDQLRPHPCSFFLLRLLLTAHETEPVHLNMSTQNNDVSTHTDTQFAFAYCLAN